MISVQGGHIVADAIFEYGERRESAPVLLDTGASGFVSIDTPFAEKLGIPLRLSGLVGGVGGMIPSFKGILHRLSLADIPECTLRNVSASVHDIFVIRPSAVALLGLDFMAKTDMVARFRPDSVKISCRGGRDISIPITRLELSPLAPRGLSPTAVVAIAGGFVVVIAGVILLSSVVK